MFTPAAREVPIPTFAVTAADATRVNVRFHAGALRSEALVPLSGVVSALAPMHEPLLSWAELRRRLAEVLAGLYGGIGVLPRLLQGATHAYPLHVVRSDLTATWEEALEALDRGEELAHMLRAVLDEHPEHEELHALLDVLEAGWQALSGICNLCGLCPMSHMGEHVRLSKLEVEVDGALCIPQLDALARLFQTPPRP